MTSAMLDLVLALGIPALPLMVGAALYFGAMHRMTLLLAPWIPLTALVLLARFYDRVIDMPWLLLGARVGIDATSAPLLLLAAVAWSLAGWHARHHIAIADRSRFFLIWLITWMGNLCVFITLDAASFYAAYSTMTFAAYGLIVFNGRPQDFRAGRVYMAMAILGESMIIAALLMLGGDFGNVALGQGQDWVAKLGNRQLVTWLFLAGFAVKAGIVPMHMWLALAHPQAPVPASAVLSGVILKAGVLGWLRFLPFEVEGFQVAGATLVGCGLFSVFYGAAISLVQDRPKTVLAYSSISQMGLIACAVGIALSFPESAAGMLSVAVLYALHHGLAKAALFLSVDVARSHPSLARAAMWIPAVVLAGAPLTSGALAKVLFKSAVPSTWTWLNDALLAGSVATTLIMARFLALAWPRTTGEGKAYPSPWVTLIVAGLSLPWLSAIYLEPSVAARPFRLEYLVEALWPPAVGIIVVLAAVHYWPRHIRPSVPEGDIIALLPRRWWSPRWWPAAPRLHWSRAEMSQRWMTNTERMLMQPGPALLVLITGMAIALLILGLMQ